MPAVSLATGGFVAAVNKVQLPEELARQVCHRVGGGCWLHRCGMGHRDSALLPPSEADHHRFLASATWSFASQRCQVLRNSAQLMPKNAGKVSQPDFAY